ncbi:hypothetical protein XM38_026420 [Halomicronema hongdechloris C2206]|uniref:Uncharacterized protein n=1 Tax=Halomicronema hongdechloris C2206 TaxID=1641165 RepID=A0A1Z3HN02_9CYAN|nr:hypothetical protein [Halomicronema hongdechloris]ASC71688.1 hypothetical protein XM38_026420 [Halomicronema hongdechloris C2206]
MTNSNNRLDRIETILANLAEQQAANDASHHQSLTRLEALVESNARTIEANSNDITAVQQRQEAYEAFHHQALTRLEALVESSARTIEANSNEIVAIQRRQEQGDQQLRTSIDDVVEMIGNLGQHIDESQQQQAERQAETDQLLQRLAAQQAETDQRFNTLLADARADRQRAAERDAANAAEHQAFQQIVQTMLAEITRLWQRLAG